MKQPVSIGILTVRDMVQVEKLEIMLFDGSIMKLLTGIIAGV